MKEHGESEGLRKTETEQEKDREKEKKETSTTEERFAKNKDSDQDEERPKTSTGVPRNDRESGGARDRLSETEESQRKQEDLEQLGASPSSPSSSRSTATASLHPDASLSDGPEKKSGRPELSSPQEKKQEAEEGERRGESPREEGQTSQRAEGRAENREKFFTLLTCAAVFSGLAYEGLRIFQLSRLENKSFQGMETNESSTSASSSLSPATVILLLAYLLPLPALFLLHLLVNPPQPSSPLQQGRGHVGQKACRETAARRGAWQVFSGSGRVQSSS